MLTIATELEIGGEFFEALDDDVIGPLLGLRERLYAGRVVGLRRRRVPRQLQQRRVHHHLLRLQEDQRLWGNRYTINLSYVSSPAVGVILIGLPFNTKVNLKLTNCESD